MAIDKKYESELDKFLAKKRSEITESASQQQERLKHDRIQRLRDNPDAADEQALWDEF